MERQGAMLFSLIDPDKTSGDKGAQLAKVSEENGADAILIGGSIGAQGDILDDTVKRIKELTSIPVVLYPGNISGLTKYADATYFMFMLNSRDVYWMSTAQIQGAPVVKRMGIEPIPTGYIIVEPGRAVGWIGNANVVPKDRPDLAYACALAAQYMGAKVVITDSGSGAPEPAPLELIAGFAKGAKPGAFYFYGGGVRNEEQAIDVIKAGADGIQVGTAFETGDVAKKIKTLSAAVKKAGKARV